jgi:hypothetical protein
LTDVADLIAAAADKTRLLLLCKSKTVLFRICTDEREYIRILLAAGDPSEARRVVMQRRIVDREVLALLGTDDPDFNAYVDRISMRSEPRFLCEAEPDLFEELMISDVPSRETMDALHAGRSYILFDPPVSKKITQYVLAHPSDWERWITEIDANAIVPVLNASEETAEFAVKIAAHGDSLECRVLASVAKKSVDFCVANAPPVRAYNLTGDRREEFEEKLAVCDPFLAPDVPDEDSEDFCESLYARELAALIPSEITPEKTEKLLRTYEWERALVQNVEELKGRVDGWLRSTPQRELPPWVETSLANERLGIRGKEVRPTASANWGLGIQLTICPVCGMQHNLGESVSSIAVFPCGHIVHVSCLHSGYCPLCYSAVVK